MAAFGVMASDGVESKMSGTNLRPGTVREIADESAGTLIEMAGVIKWFDVSKGFGFIVPDNGMPDVLTVLSGRESSVRRLDELRASVGDDPAHWYPLLTRAPWPGTPPSDEFWLEAAE